FPPASAVAAALEASRRTHRPLVIDFRDRWLGPGGYEPASETARRRHEGLEHEAISAASRIIAISDSMADAIATEHRYPREQIVVIPNGYDPRTVSPTRPTNNAKFTIAHVGTVIGRNRPDLFFQSIGQLAASGKLGDVRFRFVGNLSRDYLSRSGLDSYVET